MKSNKQRRAEIRAHRLARAARLEAELRGADPRFFPAMRTPGVVPADAALLARLNPWWMGTIPSFYLDQTFNCNRCGETSVWTARQQKWWYEDVHGRLDSRAVLCLVCRRAQRAERAAALAVEGADLVGQASRRLRALGAAPPNAAARAEVAAAFESKWWGLRSLAIGAMGSWAEPEDLAQLRQLSQGSRASWYSWERVAAMAAINALAGREVEKSEQAKQQ